MSDHGVVDLSTLYQEEVGLEAEAGGLGLVEGLRGRHDGDTRPSHPEVGTPTGTVGFIQV